MPVRRLQPPLQ